MKPKIKLMMEIRKILHQNIEAYGENFELRERVFDFSNSYQVMIYPKYMVVNKTALTLLSH